MKTTIKIISLLCAVPFLSISCMDSLRPEEDGRGKPIRLHLSCEPLDTETESRSTHSTGTLTKVSNANYYLFKDGRLVGQEYYDSIDDFCINLPSMTDKFNLYLLANVGRIVIPSSTEESAMDTAVHVDYNSKSNYFSTIETYGFPMASAVIGFSASSSTEYALKRLVHTLYVTVNTDGLNSTTMEFTGLSIKNAARDVFPFARESKAQYTMDGDAADLDEEELKALNNGERITLFLLENVRGEIFSGNTDWKRKVPKKMFPPTDKDFASYIELTASAQTSTAFYEQNVYRAYLGTSPANCNVKRSTYFELNNNFTNDMIVDEEWRIEGDTPVVNEILAFVSKHHPHTGLPFTGDNIEISEISLLPGFKRSFYIGRSNTDIKFRLVAPASNTRLKYSTEDITAYFTKVTVWSEASWDTTVPDGRLELYSEDGLIHKTLLCKTYTEPIKMKFEYGPGTDIFGEPEYTSNQPHLRMKVIDDADIYDQFELQYDFTLDGSIGGYIAYYTNGTWGKEKSESWTSDFIINKSDFWQKLKSGIFAPIDTMSGWYSCLYQDVFYELVWKITRECSLTWIGNGNSYMKHARPTFLEFDIAMKFKSEGLVTPVDSSTKLAIDIQNDDSTVTVGQVFTTNAGTDFGIYWNHCDNATNWYSERAKISYNKPYGLTKEAGRIGVTVNGKDKWGDCFYIGQ